MNVYEKLCKVQSKLIAPKNQYNSFGKYNYRSCEDILEGVKGLLTEVNAVITVSDSMMQIGDRYYIKATATFIDCETGEKVENTAFAREEESKKGMDASQVTGSTSSYARKYALNGLLCIDDVKDADTRDNSGTDKQGSSKANNKKSEFITEREIAVLNAEMKRTGVEQHVILEMCKVKALNQITTDAYGILLKKFKGTRTKGE